MVKAWKPQTEGEVGFGRGGCIGSCVVSTRYIIGRVASGVYGFEFQKAEGEG